MTSYEDIYSLALNLIDDPTLATLSDKDLESMLMSWMLQSIYKLPKLRKELSDRDDDVGTFNNDLSDTAKMALALSMKRAWLAPQIASATLTLQRSSKKESYSQSEHLKGLMSLDSSIDVELKKLIRDNTYVDSEYFG